MQLRRLGAGGPQASALALGCMGMSSMYGGADRAPRIATIHAAFEAGGSSRRRGWETAIPSRKWPSDGERA